MSERLSAEQLRDVQELPATSAGNVLMRATMRNALLAHISVLEAELQEAREQRDMLQRTLETRAERELEMLEEVQGMTLQQAIECVRDYRKWYDEKMFRPVTVEEALVVHHEFDGMVDRISAESARRTIDNLITALSSLASPSITDQ